ncbi:hypothetical protein CgunFtcFv8_007641 [Champsocephalus gunnari]|uniref:Uncharacterized protein n=1 Tax=Champsocephalus gunnari TaxID=52237 RepID=A0AAN8CM55_CHAGU|nr:hypothetical protein CgunFtcFv8_007641 [Champsocephalus gunnari]
MHESESKSAYARIHESKSESRQSVRESESSHESRKLALESDSSPSPGLEYSISGSTAIAIRKMLLPLWFRANMMRQMLHRVQTPT